jgi:hypothetical protein
VAQRRPRTCIFCGGTPLTDEDANPNWIRKLWDPASAPMEGYFKDEPVGNRLYTGMPMKVRKVVCKACNTGWMSRIQNSSKDLLEPMIGGFAEGEIHPGAQRQLVGWMTMTAMVMEWWSDLTDPPFYTPAERATFAQHLQLPHHSVGLAARRSFEKPISIGYVSTHLKRPTDPAAPPIGLAFSAVIRYFVMRLVYIRITDEVTRTAADAEIEKADPPWVTRGIGVAMPFDSPVAWPPIASIDNLRDLEAFVNSRPGTVANA